MKKRLVIFASGNGSNAVNTCRYFSNHPNIEVVGLFCNNPKAGVIQKMNALGVPVELFSRSDFQNETNFLSRLHAYHPDGIALLGFLWLVPAWMIRAYPGIIINLHPALLPKYGGKGMYGTKVHEAVKAAGEKESGITLHLVNEKYDEGAVIQQFSFVISDDDTVETIAEKVHALEQENVPKALEAFLQS